MTPLENIDWTLLRTQKATLIKLACDGLRLSQNETNSLDGILHLIDAIQDYAVDTLNISPMTVYDFELEESRGFGEE